MKDKILVNVWGYSMTIVDYYKVVRETPKTVIIRKLKSKEEHTGFLSGKSVPSDEFADEKEFRAVKPKTSFDGSYTQECFKSSLDYRGSMNYLRVWNGEAKSFNHCD